MGIYIIQVEPKNGTLRAREAERKIRDVTNYTSIAYKSGSLEISLILDNPRQAMQEVHRLNKETDYTFKLMYQ